MIISDIHISTQRLKKYNFGGFVTSFCSDITSVGFLTSFSSDLHLEVLLHLFVVMLHLEEWWHPSLHDGELNHDAGDEENQVDDKQGSPVQFGRLQIILELWNKLLVPP